jgi:LPS export ABC transporter protein LptC
VGTSRRAWRVLLAIALMLALGALGVSVSRRANVSDLVDTSFLATKALPELLQRIRNFHRVITREGRKVLEVSAREASYFKNDKAVEILEPKVVFYEGGERVGEVSAQKGRLYLDGTDVEKVEVDGDVLFELGRLAVRTGNLTYDKQSSHITARGEARVEAAELDLVGTDLTVDMVERSVVIAAGVKMTLHPKAEAPQ